MEKIDGKEIAEKIYSRIGDRSKQALKLAVITVGATKATEAFVAQKKKAAIRTGIAFKTIDLPAEAKTEEVEKELLIASKDAEITALVAQLPFPPQIDKKKALAAIAKEKDVDSLNGGPFVSPSVGTVLEILDYLGKDMASLNFAVVGHGELVGRPIYEFLSNGKAKSAKLFRRGDSLKDLAEEDIVVSGTGNPGLIKPNMLRDESIIIDFGYGTKEDGKTGGDFSAEESPKNILYTPTPGGTGPILVAKLFENIISI